MSVIALPLIANAIRKLKTRTSSRVGIPFLFTLLLIVGLAGIYWFARLSPDNPPALSTSQVALSNTDRKILYYRDPSGAPYWSAVPKKDSANRDYNPVYDNAEPSFEIKKEMPQTAANESRRILYYRNPMGLLDTSPVPKKDSMGMDYIAVYEGGDQSDSNIVKISTEKIQRSGVRTEAVEKRVFIQPVRAVGTVKIDERGLTVVAMRSDGYIEELFVNTTGQSVRVGEPLFRVYSSQIQQAQIDLMSAMKGPRLQGASSLDGPIQRLRNLGIPESRIQEVRDTGANPRTLDWPSPATGTVIEKRVVNGQRVQPGDILFRIADLSNIWVIADVAESDLGLIGLGARASVTVRAYPQERIEGTVTFIYPELRPETRTARVRIEAPNPDGRLKADMYADVIIHAGTNEATVAIPDSALIDSGTRQVVFISKGEGRFEPRSVKLGRRGSGYIEVLAGVVEGEIIVTSATFLIDSESNLKAALKSFTQPEPAK